MTDVVMPVSPEPVKTVTVKAPSEPLPPGMRFVKKTPRSSTCELTPGVATGSLVLMEPL